MAAEDEPDASGSARRTIPPDEAEGVGYSQAQAVLQRLLVEMGVPQVEVEAATRDNTLHLLALERLVSLDPAHYTLEEVATASGLQPEQIRAYWRALGFPDPRPGEKLFSDTDLDMLEAVVPFISEGSLDPALAVQMSRVIGSSLSRIATAQIEAIEREVSRQVEDQADNGSRPLGSDDAHDDSTGDADETDEDLVVAAQRAAELLPMMPQLMEFVWRRHLGAAARRRIMRASGAIETEGCCIGFADLVGFTAQTQQLPETELAEVVARFENIAYDQVAAHGGRVIKMIGDEVMFLTDDIRAGAMLALDLADAYRNDADLSDVRVGMASGPVLERDGDVYGPVVNLAHRIVSIAYPGAVVVDATVRDALDDDEDFTFRSIRSHYLKDIGRIPLWAMRRSGDESEALYRRARDRRAARREFLLERRARPGRRMAEVAAGSSTESGAVQGLAADLLEEDVLGEGATTAEFEALTDAVLLSDLDDEQQVDLLAEIEAARRLRALEEEAQQKADEADLEAERKVREAEQEARRKVQEAEREARRKVEHALAEAEAKSREANEEATRKVKRVAEEVERKADRAEKEAKREAKRKAAKRRRK